MIPPEPAPSASTSPGAGVAHHSTINGTVLTATFEPASLPEETGEQAARRLWGAGEEVCSTLRQAARKIGIDLGDAPKWQFTCLEARKDPYSQEISWIGQWRGQARYGTVCFFADGRVFAEYQVLLPHPGKPSFFVEAVSAWGIPGELKTDITLLPVLE